MRQTGIVLSAQGNTATVRFQRSSACGKCNACFHLGKSEADIELDNALGAKPGDRVIIELHGKTVVKASVIVYGVPLVALIAGIAIGSAAGDLYAALAGVLFAAGAFFLLRALEPRFSRMREFKPRMIDFAGEEDTNEKQGGGEENAEAPDDSQL